MNLGSSGVPSRVPSSSPGFHCTTDSIFLARIKSFANKSIQDKRQNEGETCMHGNAWNSNCSECDEMETTDNVLFDVFELVGEYPNDAELGAKVREFYNSYTTNSDNTEE